MPDTQLKTEYDYELLKKFTYSVKGEQQEAEFVRLIAPSSRHSKECAALKQAFFRAINRSDAEAGAEDVQDVEITGQDVITMIAMAKDVDLPDVMEVAKTLFLNGIAVIDGETRLTKPMLENIAQEDLECMLGEYMANFTLASYLARMKEKSSKGS